MAFLRIFFRHPEKSKHVCPIEPPQYEALSLLKPVLHPMDNSSNGLWPLLEHYQYNRQYLSRVPQVHYLNARS